MRPRAHRLNQRVRRALSVLSATLLVVTVGLVASVSTPAPAEAAAPASISFDAGRIIDDAVFYNGKTMTEAQIQTFLNGKVPNCQSGYTCLKDFKQNTSNKSADQMCSGYTGGTNESAARIIAKVAASCGINAQAILVMLQKEQGLVTHTWPSNWRFDAALGQDCPDTPAGCSAAYKGFFSQIYGGAWQLKRYSNPAGTSNFFNWYPVGATTNVLWQVLDVKPACGSGPVYIKNKATAALYYYTPYQPNAAALKAGYGTGDRCSAYGNRNFYNYFTDWFGSTYEQGTVPKPTPTPTPTPTPLPAPTWKALADDGAVLGFDGATLWAYPQRATVSGARVAVATGLSSVARLEVIGDLTGDGIRDLLTVKKDGTVTVTAGSARAFDGKVRTLPIRATKGTSVYAAGDFTGDGIPDLFTTDAEGRLFLWRGTADGGVTGPTQIGSGWSKMSQLSGGVDFDGDGNVDLIARNENGDLVLYPGDGAGGWKASRVIGVGWGEKTAILVSPDVTADGRADVVARNPDGTMQIYSGMGNGAFGAVHKYGKGWDVLAQVLTMSVKPGAARASRTAGAGDVDADGARDVLTVTTSGDLVLYRGNNAGGWRGTETLRTGWKASDQLLTLGDFTGDGLRDAGRISSDGVLSILRGTTAGGFSKPTPIGQGWQRMSQVFGGIDFDGDGATDVIARDENGDLFLYRGDGNGGWAGTSRIGTRWDSFDMIFNIGDFDGDGYPDVAARDANNGDLWLYPTTGKNGWKPRVRIGTGWGSFTALAGTGDFTGDGNPDVLARDSDGRLLLYGGNGRGGWSTGGRQIGVGWNIIATIR